MKTVYVVEARHSSTSELHDPIVCLDKSKAIDAAHKFFLDFGFELREGKPYDPGNGPSGFDVFDNVKIIKGKVAEFMHFGGDGPICTIVEGKLIE